MPFHSKSTLEHWVAEFVDARSGGEEIRVAVQESDDGQDTGLVVVPLENAPNTVWIEPRSNVEDFSWHVLIEPSTQTLDLTSFELNALTHELQIAAELCAFLQERSLGHFDPTGSPESSPEATPSG